MIVSSWEMPQDAAPKKMSISDSRNLFFINFCKNVIERILVYRQEKLNYTVNVKKCLLVKQLLNKKKSSCEDTPPMRAECGRILYTWKG